MSFNNEKPRTKKKSKSSKKTVNLDSLPWKEVTVAKGFLSTDDAGGFLGLEEIEGVDLQTSENSFVLKQPVKSSKKIKKTKELSEEEVIDFDPSNFIHVDDFDEEALENQKPLPKPEKKQKSSPQVQKESTINSETKQKATTSEPKQKKPTTEVKPKTTSGQNQKRKLTEVEDIPLDRNYVKNWEQFNLADPILKALQQMKFQTPTLIQSQALPHALQYKDIIGCAETGSGKTLAFGLPMIQRLATMDTEQDDGSLFGLILSPTRELAMQIAGHLKAVSQYCRIKIAAIVGGMSIQKQERLFENSPHIIVATPGRLWEIIDQNPAYESRLRKLKVLVLDEADRMIERGHFKELELLFDLLNKKSSEEKRSKRQTFLFSATLEKSTDDKKKKQPKASIDDIINRVQLHSKKPVLIDLSSKKLTSENLVERRVDCVSTDKDKYLYYFVTRYPGRTLVFVNSIDTIRRLVPLLVFLGINALPLHAQMQQRQRLKNVDRFKSLECSVLVASDVASRGLDIPGVEHIIHYQLARTSELYIHRSGRTARAQNQGLSIMLCCPEEIKSYRNICVSLKRTTIPEFPVDKVLVSKLGPRVTLAKKIDTLQHKLNKVSSEKNWFIKNAADMEIELDSDFLSESDPEDGPGHSRANTLSQIANLKEELKHLLQQSVLPRGASSYITNGLHSQLVDNLSQSNKSGTFKGFSTYDALADAQLSKK